MAFLLQLSCYCVCRSSHTFVESALCLHLYMGSGDPTSIVGFARKALYLLSTPSPCPWGLFPSSKQSDGFLRVESPCHRPRVLYTVRCSAVSYTHSPLWTFLRPLCLSFSPSPLSLTYMSARVSVLQPTESEDSLLEPSLSFQPHEFWGSTSVTGLPSKHHDP